MSDGVTFHTRTALAEGLRQLFKQLGHRLALRQPPTVSRWRHGGPPLYGQPCYDRRRVVSKITRLADNGREDIRALVAAGLTSAAEIEDRATHALGGYVGGIAMSKANFRHAIEIAREAEVDAIAESFNRERPRS